MIVIFVVDAYSYTPHTSLDDLTVSEVSLYI